MRITSACRTPMKHRLTLTVDAEIVLRAKRHARAHGVSLVVHWSSRGFATWWTEGAPSFAARWRGRLRPADGDDPRYEALARKYL